MGIREVCSLPNKDYTGQPSLSVIFFHLKSIITKLAMVAANTFAELVSLDVQDEKTKIYFS